MKTPQTDKTASAPDNAQKCEVCNGSGVLDERRQGRDYTCWMCDGRGAYASKASAQPENSAQGDAAIVYDPLLIEARKALDIHDALLAQRDELLRVGRLMHAELYAMDKRSYYRSENWKIAMRAFVATSAACQKAEAGQ